MNFLCNLLGKNVTAKIDDFIFKYKEKRLEAEKASEKGQKRAVWLAKQPRCLKCGVTSDEVSERMKAIHSRGPLAHQNLVKIGNLVAVCPKCRNAFCNDHLIPGNPHDWFDDAKCPLDKTVLDAYWDQPPSEDKPWRIGPYPE